MTSQLLLPNPLMPPEVRMVHLLENVDFQFSIWLAPGAGIADEKDYPQGSDDTSCCWLYVLYPV